MIRSWNKGAEQLFGYTAGEVLGRSVSLFLPADRRHEEQEIFDRLRRGERVEPFVSSRIRKDGQTIDVFTAISPVYNPAGELIGVFRVTRRVSDCEAPPECRDGSE